MWKLTTAANGWEPLPGIPWRDMTDKEFQDVAKAYAEREFAAPSALAKSGFFEHVEDKKSSSTAEGDK